jgi:hypothetical protein
MPEQAAKEFARSLGMTEADGKSGLFVPVNQGNGGSRLDWWTPPPPESQTSRFVRQIDGIMVCVWNQGQMYLFKEGGI